MLFELQVDVCCGGGIFDDAPLFIIIDSQAVFVLLQLFKQGEEYNYKNLDVHMLTCLTNISSTYRNAKMDYSWNYTYDDDEEKLGPTCKKIECEHTNDEINTSLLTKGFKLKDPPDPPYGERYPEYKTKKYSKDQNNNLILDDDIELATELRVECIDSETIGDPRITCKYDQGTREANFAIDIGELNYSDWCENPLGYIIPHQIEVGGPPDPFRTTYGGRMPIIGRNISDTCTAI